MITSEQAGSVFDHFMANGANLFNAARLAPTEEEHCRLYYGFVQPLPNSVVVDLGCGIGEVGAWFQQFDPSLKVTNVVNNLSLIEKMVEMNRECLNASMESTNLPDGYANTVMFNESIGHVDLNAAFVEAARLLKPNGVLAIKDFSITDQSKISHHLYSWDYTVYQPEDFMRAAISAGFSLQVLVHPPMFTKHWFDIINKSQVARDSAMLHDPAKLPLCMSLYRFVKGNLNGRSLDCS
jgi:SAM-dependent methyltransferase